MSVLANKRILLVEDEALVAAMAEDMLIELGATVLGPATTIAKGLALAAADGEIDAAVLDINIRGERVDPVADALRERGVPVVFASGYGEYHGDGTAVVIDKPYSRAKLSAALLGVLRLRA